MKKYKIKITPELKQKLKWWWNVVYRIIEDDFWEEIQKAEKKMREDTGIEDIEFFFAEEQGAVGIGNSSRTMPLIRREELE